MPGADILTFMLAVASGVANGTFPVFIKTPRVLSADVHPVVFQLYKSSWVMIAGLGCALVRVARGLELAYTPWATASAAAWIPSGVTTIIAVPLIGVGPAVLTTSAMGSALSFLVFWLGFGEPMKTHDIGGAEIPLAPVYMLGSIVGMGGLVAAHRASLRDAARLKRLLAVSALSDSDEQSVALNGDAVAAKPSSRGWARAKTLLGYVAASVSGVFSSLQFGVVTYGKSVAGPPPSPTAADERFDALGSWLAAFGVSAVACTLVAYACLAAYSGARGAPCPPSLELRVMLGPGSGAGIFWTVANVCATLAVLRGGQATTIATINCFSLITSGLWGLLWYRELKGRPAVAWAVAAAFTAAMSVLLSMEKG